MALSELFFQHPVREAPRRRQAGWLSVRFSRKSEGLISMHNVNHQVACSIEVTSLRGLADNDEWMRRIEDAALFMGGRPHWGQQNRLQARRAKVDASARREPAGAVAESGQLPATQTVEFGDEHQKAVRGRVNVRAQRGDLIAQVFDDVRVGWVICNGIRRPRCSRSKMERVVRFLGNLSKQQRSAAHPTPYLNYTQWLAER